MAEHKWWVGVDWGNESHAVCVLSADGVVHKQIVIEHEGAALTELADMLVALASAPSEVAVAIETPHGPVVATLLEREIAVYSINPKQVDRFRDRFTVAGAKDDRRDALVLASSLRTDLALFKRVVLAESDIVELRELVRMHEELKREAVMLGNRLEEQLRRFYPQILKLGSVHDERWLWDLLARGPTPAEGARLSLAKLETILVKHRIRRHTAKDVRAVLATPALHVAPGVVAASCKHIERLLPRLRLAYEQLKETRQDMDAILEKLEASSDIGKHRDATILRSLPGVGTVVSATMLAEASQPLMSRDYQALRTLAGVAPVTKRSGKMLVVGRRYQRSRLVENAVYFWAAGAALRDERARSHYAALRARGHNHARAVRGVADRLLAVLVAMLQQGTLYDSSLRKAA